MKTISAEAYLAFDGTKFFDRDACRLYEQDEVLKPFAEKMAKEIYRAESCLGVGISVPTGPSGIRRFLRENRKELLDILQGMTP